MVGIASLVADLTPIQEDAGEARDVMGCPASIFPVSTDWRQPRVLCHCGISHAHCLVHNAEASYITWIIWPFQSRN
jgi:hypothetical protein